MPDSKDCSPGLGMSPEIAPWSGNESRALTFKWEHCKYTGNMIGLYIARVPDDWEPFPAPRVLLSFVLCGHACLVSLCTT